jgi:dihydropteroate synthase
MYKEEKKPLVMGILNVTPDSFYAGSRVAEGQVLAQAEKMIAEGADILDIGGMSTRPGAVAVSETEELRRTTGAVACVARHFPSIKISIDTYRSGVARAAVAAGAHIVNDVSGGRHDALLLPTVAALGVPYILMHSIGNSVTMQQNPEYEDVVEAVLAFFKIEITRLHTLGIKDITLDVGFGFGKTIAHNYALLRDLRRFEVLDCPVLVGISRKSMVYKYLDITPEAALPATSALHLFALQQGAQVLRTHDVREAVQTIRLWEGLRGWHRNILLVN